MLHDDARPNLVSKTQSRDAALPRDRLPTLPYDLREYAWLHTGPASWTAERSDGLSTDDERSDDPSEVGPNDRRGSVEAPLSERAAPDDDDGHGVHRLMTAHRASRVSLIVRRCAERIVGAPAAGAAR